MEEVPERSIVRIERSLGRQDRVRGREEEAEGDGEASLEVSAVSGRRPPAGPQWTVRLRPPEAAGMAYEKPLCVSQDGFTLHAATRAGGLDTAGREALLRYVLRPPIAQDKVEARPDGLVRIVLKKAYADGTIAVDLDPLSLLCRLAASVRPPRHHTVRYAGVLGAASEWRSRIVPAPEAEGPEAETVKTSRGAYRKWADLLGRTFGVDALACPACGGRMRPIAVVRNPASMARYLEGVGERTELPARTPDRGPPYWKSTVLRWRVLGGEDT